LLNRDRTMRVVIEGLGEDRALRTLVNGKVAASLGRLHVPATTARVQFANETRQGQAGRALLDHRGPAAPARASRRHHGREFPPGLRAGIRHARAPGRARPRAPPRGAAPAEEVLPRQAAARAGGLLEGAAGAARCRPSPRPPPHRLAAPPSHAVTSHSRRSSLEAHLCAHAVISCAEKDFA